MLTTKIIDREHAGDIKLPNETFAIYGRLIPKLNDGKWSYETIRFETPTELRFPDEDYDFDALSADHTFIGLYDGEACVGLAVLAQDMFKYLYLDDLKVNSAYRGQGGGKMLIDACLNAAAEQGYQGVWTIGQDDNLAACLFYLKCGFEIGGFDNRVYAGTSQENKANVMFYRDAR